MRKERGYSLFLYKIRVISNLVEYNCALLFFLGYYNVSILRSIFEHHTFVSIHSKGKRECGVSIDLYCIIHFSRGVTIVTNCVCVFFKHQMSRENMPSHKDDLDSERL